MSLTIEHLIQRKHIFKKRSLNWTKRQFHHKVGSIGFFSLRVQMFELVYLRRLKKLIRRRHIRAKMKFKRRKFWIFLKPNCLFSGKSVNSRMGAGVGSYIRVATRLKAYKSFLEFKHYSYCWVKKIPAATRFRLPLKYTVIYK
jgi:ribosomal protein L16/L10AE